MTNQAILKAHFERWKIPMIRFTFIISALDKFEAREIEWETVVQVGPSNSSSFGELVQRYKLHTFLKNIY